MSRKVFSVSFLFSDVVSTARTCVYRAFATVRAVGNQTAAAETSDHAENQGNDMGLCDVFTLNFGVHRHLAIRADHRLRVGAQ